MTNNLFTHTVSNWVRYSEYEFFEAPDGKRYIMPTKNAKVKIYNPLENAQQMVIDALNVGLKCMAETSTEDDKKEAVCSFINNYGLLGFMTALPTTPKFMDYEAVYLLKNRYVQEETLKTEDYINIFFPARKPQILRHGINTMWTIEGDKDMMALAMTMDNRPMAVNMEFQREYVERYDWLVKQFKDWAFTFFTSTLYYDEAEMNTEDDKNLLRQGMAAFDGLMPTYHIELLDKPTFVWDFQSLLLAYSMKNKYVFFISCVTLAMCISAAPIKLIYFEASLSALSGILIKQMYYMLLLAVIIAMFNKEQEISRSVPAAVSMLMPVSYMTVRELGITSKLFMSNLNSTFDDYIYNYGRVASGEKIYTLIIGYILICIGIVIATALIKNKHDDLISKF